MHSPKHRFGCCRHFGTPGLDFEGALCRVQRLSACGRALHFAWGCCQVVKQVLVGKDGCAHMARAARR